MSKDTYTEKHTPQTPLDALLSYEDAPYTASDAPGAVGVSTGKTGYTAGGGPAPKTPMDALRGYETDPAPAGNSYTAPMTEEEPAPMAWQIICWGSADPNVPPIGRDVLLELIEKGRRVHLIGRFAGWIAATPRRAPLWVVSTPDGPQTLLTPEVHAWHPLTNSVQTLSLMDITT